MQAHRNPFLVAIKTSTEVCDAAKKYLDQAQELTNAARASVLHYDLLKQMDKNSLEQRHRTTLAITRAEKYVNDKIEILFKLDFSKYDDQTEILIDQHREALEDVEKELEDMHKFVDEIDQRP